ncbi:MAG TPA: alanine racemase [Bryobacteraceae bacterium]|jgi:D-serine deaminase-like pyridoxal phosphate-dependent protein|nr:alanine racemase [Bryobacteraceae bacterium]
MRVADIDTPALLVDLDVMEHNLRRVADYTQQHGLRLRPHTKTHKSPRIGRRQLDLGAAGLTVAKVGEAEVMLDAAPPDMLVAYPVIGRAKLERLIAVARRARVTVSLDSLYAAEQLSEAAHAAGVAVGVLAETDVGLGRVGVSPGSELLDLARGIKRLPGLTFEGIAFYPGHIKDDGADGRQALAALGGLIQSMLADFRREGIEVRIVSGGSTPSLFHSHELPGLNEIRPGTYVYNDWNTVASGACTPDQCAAALLVTVVSTARPGQIIVDGGSKTFSSDRLTGSSAESTFGHVVEAPAALFHKMNEEHGYVDVRLCDRKFEIGERLRIIPNHVCVAVNLHARMYGTRNGEVEEVWEVAGRGKLQ